MSRLFLFDGTALAYRSHYAFERSRLSTADGSPTGATYGFTMALRQILEEASPELVAVAFDPPGPTFRHERYSEYKATRQRAPEEMKAQLPWIKEVVEAHGIPIFEVPGFEADDVIGTLAIQGEAAGHEVFIVTGDKDFMQLVNERVQLYNIFRKGSQLEIQGIDTVKEKFGTTPDRVIDVLAIMGDASDNVPGVKGIGEKGAIKLIDEFGSVDSILEHLDEVKGKTKDKIEASREMLLLSRELVTIDTAVPLDSSVADLGPAEPDRMRLVELFQRLQFQTLVTRVAENAHEQPEEERDYNLVRDPEALEVMLTELRDAGSFAVDTETTSLFPLQSDLVGVSFSAANGRAFYVPFNLDPPLLPGGKPALLEALRPLLTDPSLERTGQNTKYDWLVFKKQGIDLPPPNFDTMVASFCAVGSNRNHGLDTLSLHYFGLRKIPTKQLIGTGKKQITMDQVPIKELSDYACEDADFTWRLRGVLEPELEKAGALSLFHDLEMPLVPVLAAMEARGIRLDTDLLEELGVSLEEDLKTLVFDIQGLAGENLNVNSTKALGEVLFEKLRIQDDAGVKKPKRTKTGWATDAETLTTRYGEVPIVQKLLEYRELAKLNSTYVKALPSFVNRHTGRVHCSFSQVSAATGRLASSDPNLQNIPIRRERGRKLREAFVPREPDELGPWCLMSADYSQIELRILAHLSGDEHMRRAFEEGQDVHAATAMRIFGVTSDEISREMRSQAKVINFGLLYGMGPQRLARETGFTVPEAREFMERYFASFPTVKGWIDALLEKARQTGYVETLLGRRRRVPELNSSNSRVRSFAENAAVNTPVQGSAADVIKRAMIDLERELTASPLAAGMLLQVHDELVLEVPLSQLDETRELVRKCMTEAVALSVPLEVDFGHGANWLEAH